MIVVAANIVEILGTQVVLERAHLLMLRRAQVGLLRKQEIVFRVQVMRARIVMLRT